MYRPVIGSDADDEHPAGKSPVGKTRSGRYRSGHGDSSRVLHSREGRPAAGAEDARPPGFPSVEELCDLNRAIDEDAGQPERYKLDQPAPLESCLDRARAGYAASPEGVVKVAAALAHGIAQAQAFRDGNRRTAISRPSTFSRPTVWVISAPRPPAIITWLASSIRSWRTRRACKHHRASRASRLCSSGA